jgi:hypothetical protein
MQRTEIELDANEKYVMRTIVNLHGKPTSLKMLRGHLNDGSFGVFNEVAEALARQIVDVPHSTLDDLLRHL